MDTVRYSVPHRLVSDRVEVLVTDDEVHIFHGPTLVALHARSFEPHAQVIDSSHLDGLWRTTERAMPTVGALQSLGRSLEDYAAIIGGAA